jgi:putative membrane protein
MRAWSFALECPILNRMKPFLVRWAVTTGAVFIAAPLSGIRYEGYDCLIGASLILGIVNAFIRPVLLLLSLPLILVTMGLFILVVNGLMLYMVGGLLPCFHVGSFGSAFLGAILIGVVSWLLSAFFKTSDGHVRVITHHSQVKPVRGRVIK